MRWEVFVVELVYLWVEDYKNIHRQGFNFSPRFNCDYDPDTNELIIEENDDYIENFFGGNTDVTVIAGKNGSGKSAILKSILEGFVNPDKTNIKLFDSNKEIISTNSDNTYIIYWDYSITDESFKELTTFQDDDELSGVYQILPSKVDINNEGKIDIIRDIQNLAKTILFNLQNEAKDIKIIQDFFTPLYILLSSKEEVNDFDENTDDLTFNYFKDFYDYNLENSSHCYRVEINDENINKIKNNISKYKFIDFEDERGKKLLTLSFGELQLMKIMLMLYSSIRKAEDNFDYIVLLLDELELGLHPNWQKKIISNLIKFKPKSKLKFILTSHSPFFISDVPKENIVFLDTDKHGNCLAVDGLKEKKETFGANIHTLLSDSFFMEDGLMGDFAKGKIDEVIKLLGKELLEPSEIKYCEQIISIIGEPIIKNKLQKMLDSKRLKKIDEIDAIKDTIEELQKRLSELENEKS